MVLVQNGKDLVQEVTQLRRSLDDAEGLSLETKKEWAFLRSENLSLKERDVSIHYLSAKNRFICSSDDRHGDISYTRRL